MMMFWNPSGSSTGRRRRKPEPPNSDQENVPPAHLYSLPGSATCTSTPESGIETAATTTPYSQREQHTLSRSQCIPVCNIFNELNRAVTPLSDISNHGSSKRTREGWGTVKEGVLSQNTSNTIKKPPCQLNSPTLNLNERSSGICSGNSSVSGIIPLSVVCPTPFISRNVMKLNQGSATTGMQSRSAKRMKPGNDSVLAQNTSNTLNHATRHLNSPIVNLKERTTSCTPPQTSSNLKRTPLSNVTNTKDDHHPRNEVKGKKSRSRIPSTDNEGTTRQLFGIQKIYEDTTIEHNSIASQLEDADHLFDQNDCETDYAETEDVDNSDLPQVTLDMFLWGHQQKSVQNAMLLCGKKSVSTKL
ncbi:hypothetical protein ACET3Z_015564 [Daucus carota]